MRGRAGRTFLRVGCSRAGSSTPGGGRHNDAVRVLPKHQSGIWLLYYQHWRGLRLLGTRRRSLQAEESHGTSVVNWVRVE